MLYYLRFIHYKFKKLIDAIFNVIFVFLHHIYRFCREKYLERKRSRYTKDDPAFQTCISMEMSDLASDSENLIQEIKRNGKLPIKKTKTDSLINTKNNIKKWFTTIIFTASYLCLFYNVMWYTFYLISPSDDIIFESTETQCNVSWFHANVGVRKYDTFKKMKESYGHVMQQPCRPLDVNNIETNILPAS